jgi:hypothetical protein
MIDTKAYRTVQGYCPVYERNIYINVIYIRRDDFSLYPVGFMCGRYRHDEQFIKICDDCPVLQEYIAKYFQK